MAKKAELHDYYLLYRQLSGDAAHPTVTSLNRYIADSAGNQFRTVKWGSPCGSDELPDTLSLACSFLISASLAANEIRQSEALAGELNEHYQTYKVMVGQ
jgi:hypothetical protein